MEKSWQFPDGFIPRGSADAEKKARRRSAPRNRLPVSTRRKFVSWRRFLPSMRKASLIAGEKPVPGNGFTGVPGRVRSTRFVP